MNGANKAQLHKKESTGISVMTDGNRAEPSTKGAASRFGLLASAMQCIDDGVVIVDREGKVLFSNEAAERIVGLGDVDVPPEEWPSAYGCYLPDKVTLHPWEELPLVRAMRGEHVHEAEVFIRNSGTPSGAWISINSSPLLDETGGHSGGIIVFRDVTEHKRSQEVVQRLSKAVERTTDSVFITDEKGIIEYVNPAFEVTTGYTREEVIGCRPNILKSGLQSRKYYDELWTNVLAGNVFRGTPVNKKKNGELFHAEQTITPVRDDVGNLTHFVSVMRDVTDIKRAEEREIEMRFARIVQQKLYPSKSPDLPGFDVAGTAFPADATCGDCFDFIPMSDGCLGIVVGDVSGHGFSSALLMAETRAYLRSLARTTSDLGEILKQLNTFLCHDTDDERYVTLMLVRLDPARRSFLYASAGHIPGYLIDASGSVKTVLESTSMPLGIFPETEFASSQEQTLVEGDLILMMTDGVTECQNHEEDFFAEERALQVVAAERQSDAQEIVNKLYAAIRDFAPDIPPCDDVTAVVAKALSPR
jgi:sigma-B regulation protein RsbU (phosphoserine phosphatase)